jgi:hypothetical protein
MANETHANISWNTLEGTPIDRNIVHDGTGTGEYGIVAGETAAFVLLWRIVIDTE